MIEPRVIKKMRLFSISLVEKPLHPSWRIESVDGKPVEQGLGPAFEEKE